MPSLVVLESVEIRPMRALKISTILEHDFTMPLFLQILYTFFSTKFNNNFNMDSQSEQPPRPQNEHIVFLNARVGGAYDSNPSWITSTVRDENFLASVDALEQLKERWDK